MAERTTTLGRAVVEVGVATIVGAGTISASARSPELAALLLGGIVCAHLVHRRRRGARFAWLGNEVFLLTTTGTIGYLTEAWGTTHGHWSYAHLPPGTTVPLWVPLAWALAAVLVDRIGERVREQPLSAGMRFAAVSGAGIFFPWLGESICIASGVWTYHWPVQIAGVPVLALLLIAYAHGTFALIRRGSTVVVGSWDSPQPGDPVLRVRVRGRWKRSSGAREEGETRWRPEVERRS